jgi:hypothetical protein
LDFAPFSPSETNPLLRQEGDLLLHIIC